jgi:hypothetical protein
MANDNDDVNFEMDPSEAFQKLSERFLELEAFVKASLEHFDQALDQIVEAKLGRFDQVLEDIKQKDGSIAAALSELRQLIHEAKNQVATRVKPPTPTGGTFDA